MSKKRKWLIEHVIRQNGLCALCKKQLSGDANLDHIIPLSRRGSDTFENTQATHPLCNMKKGNHLPTETVRESFRVINRRLRQEYGR